MDEETLLRAFPIHFLTISFIIGLTLTFISPLNLLLPKVIANPFSFTLPSEVLSSLISVILFALLLGSPFYFLKYVITGNRGINQWLRNRSPVRVTGNYEKSKLIQDKDLANYAKWIAKQENNGLNQFLNSICCENSIVCGLFIGLEIAIILSVAGIFTGLIVIYILAPIGLNITMLGILANGIWEVIARLAFCTLALAGLWTFNKFYWNKHMSERVGSIRQQFTVENVD